MLSPEEKSAKLEAALLVGTVRVLAANGLNRLQIEASRVHQGSLQARIKGEWEYLSTRVPFFARTDVRLW